MNANLAPSTSAKDHLAGELTELAYPVALRQGVHGFSIDVELEIWEAIQAALRQAPGPWPAPEDVSEDVLAGAADAAYRVALRRGFSGAFLDLELGLWHAVHADS